MKRHICAAVGALVLAVAGAGTATASGLPVLDQGLDLQSVRLGDQSVGEQTNTADVTQNQGNRNLNISPAIAIGGDASTWNAQGNGNTALAGVEQSNEASQAQSVEQDQAPTNGSSGCCEARDVTQVVEGGDQSVGKQKNETDVTQSQGNGNVNISPAIAIGGDASTSNEQGNGNTAVAVVDQANAVDQSQDVTQTQSASGDGSCCGGQSQSATQDANPGDQTVDEQKNEADVTQSQGNGNVNVSPAIAIGGDASTWNAQGNGNTAVAVVDQANTAEQSQDVTQTQEPASGDGACCGGQSQSATQVADLGDQTVGEQKNVASATQEQGNHNLNVSPAIAIGGGKHDSCNSSCSKGKSGGPADASTANAQGNGNKAIALVEQSNTVAQTQDVRQKQELPSNGCCTSPCKTRCDEHPCSSTCGEPKPEKHECCGGPSQAGDQRVRGGDQSVEKQENKADVTQKQGNGNANVSPAFAWAGSTHASCPKPGYDRCEQPGDNGGATASTWNLQGNGNTAVAWLSQSNDVDQSQSTWQGQSLVERCKEAIRW